MRFTVASLVVMALSGCGEKTPPTPAPEAADAAAPADASVLLAEWTGPYGGVPPLDRVETDMFLPAMRQAMEEERTELEAIASQTDPATFENTVVAMQTAGASLQRVSTVLGIFSSSSELLDFIINFPCLIN